MQFYNASTKQGICQKIDRLCDSDDTSYPRLDKTSEVNIALETIAAMIIHADGNWQWDDTNNTTNPIGTGLLVEGQTSYSFSDDFLEIEEVDVLDNNGIYRRLRPIDPAELDGESAETYFGISTATTPKGLPVYYDKQGNNIKLYPAPTSTAVTLVAGIKVHFKRTAVLFTAVGTTATDTTTPGFASPYHTILAYMAALSFCESYKKDRVPLYEKRIDEMKKELMKFYGHREQDRRKIMTTSMISFR